jgi:hypothetical protein
VLILDMIEVLPPLGKYKYDTWRILSVKCYIDNSMRLWSCTEEGQLLRIYSMVKLRFHLDGRLEKRVNS